MPGFATIIYPVTDLTAAKTFFSALLGVEPTVDAPYYVGYDVPGTDGGSQHIGLDPHGHARGLTGPIPYAHVDDVEAQVKLLVDAGATVVEAPHDPGGGGLIATLKDPAGNLTGLRQAG